MGKFWEGDLVKSVEGIIFDVKGLVHPPDKVIAFPRFIPDSNGNRRGKDVGYRKVYGLSERFKFLEQNNPNYIVHDDVFDETLCEVPLDNVKHHYSPIERLKELRSNQSLDELENVALELLKVLRKSANVSWSSIGISGSILVKLHTPNSDIDPVVYGSENCRKVYAVLHELLKTQETPFKPYNREDLRVLFDFRSKDTFMSFEDFVVVESRKVLQGKFMERDYFIRFVKDWNEVDEKYGDVCYKNCGYAKIEAKVADDSESIFTPCTYKIDNVKIVEGPKLEPIEEISSFRGRFCEQAKNGEIVIAQGKLERVIDCRKNQEYYRLLLGGKTSDYMILKHQK
jgi:predicted nucleotidyltransferase